MASAQELERLVVRLVGEGSPYKKVLDDAVKQTVKAAAKIEAIVDKGMSLAPAAVLKAQAKHNALLTKARGIVESVRTPTERYTRQLTELNQVYKKGAVSTKVYERAVEKLNREFSMGMHKVAAYGSKMRSLGRDMRGFGTMATFAVTLPIVGMIASFGSFDNALTKSTAIMSDVTANLRNEMKKTALEISRNSTTSARDLAAAYFFLASAGLDAVRSIAALPVVERFAVAGAFDMAQATDLLTDAQSALGMTSKDAAHNMEGMLRVSDILVKANTLANASVQQFSEALTNEAGAAIKQYNMDLEEGVAILAAYADQGIKGQVAGSMMARMTRLLIKAINDNGEAFNILNVDYEEFAKTGKNLTGVIADISRAVEGMGPAQKAATLNMLGFEARVQQAILPLLGITDGIRAYDKALRDAGGTTDKVANKQLRSFWSELKMVWNRVNELAVIIGGKLAPSVGFIGGVISKMTVWFRGLSGGLQQTIAIMVGVVAVVGPLLIAMGAVVILIGLTTTAFAALNLAALPWLVLAGAITVAVIGIALVWGWAIKQMTIGFKRLWAVTKQIGSFITRMFLRVGQGIENAFWWAVKQGVGAVTWLARKIAGVLDFFGVISAKTANAAIDMMNEIDRKVEASAKHANQFYEDQIKKSLNNATAAWSKHKAEVEKIHNDLEKHTEEMVKAGGGDVPPTTPDVSGVGDGSTGVSKNSFKVMSLRRFAVGPLGGAKAPKKQEVTDKGVQDKMDELIGIARGQGRLGMVMVR